MVYSKSSSKHNFTIDDMDLHTFNYIIDLRIHHEMWYKYVINTASTITTLSKTIDETFKFLPPIAKHYTRANINQFQIAMAVRSGYIGR